MISFVGNIDDTVTKNFSESIKYILESAAQFTDAEIDEMENVEKENDCSDEEDEVDLIISSSSESESDSDSDSDDTEDDDDVVFVVDISEDTHQSQQHQGQQPIDVFQILKYKPGCEKNLPGKGPYKMDSDRKKQYDRKKLRGRIDSAHDTPRINQVFCASTTNNNNNPIVVTLIMLTKYYQEKR